MVLQPSTSLEIQINMKGELEREASTVFEACRIQGDRTGKKTSRDILGQQICWPAPALVKQRKGLKKR